MVIEEELKKIDWYRFFSLVKGMGRDFNDPSHRFLKSIILDKAIEKYSKGYLKYVDTKWCDFITSDGLKIQSKFCSKMYNLRTMKVKNKFQVLLFNPFTNSTFNSYNTETFDYLLLTSLECCAIVKTKVIEENLGKGNNQIMLYNAKEEHLNWIVPPNSFTNIQGKEGEVKEKFWNFLLEAI